MTHVKARAWIKRLPEGQGHPLDAGAKLLLMELWDRVDWSRESDSPARDCYPSRRRLAEDTGTTLDTIKSRLVRLAAAGWIRREGDGWALAWARPWPVDPGETSPAPGHRSPGSHVTPGDTDPDPRVIQTPAKGDSSPDPGSQVTRIPSQDQAQNQPHDRDRSTSTPEPEPPPSSPPPAKPRKRKAAPPRAGQAALELGTEPEARDVVAELLELHGRLRAEAQRHHGEEPTELPGPKTTKGSAMRRGCRQAVKQRGEAWCREMLEWQGARWKANASQLAWSGHNVWTSTSCDNAARFMTDPARAAPARRGPTLSAPPPGEIPKYTPNPTTDEDNDAWNF